MAWTPPSGAEIQERFPALASLDDAYVHAVAYETGEEIAAGAWIETDRTAAALNLAAHRLLASAASGTGGAGVPTGAVVAARTVGDVRTEFKYPGESRSVSISVSDLSSTEYGRRYLELLRRSFPPVLVV